MAGDQSLKSQATPKGLNQRSYIEKQSPESECRNWPVQNEIRSVLGQMTTGTARRIHNSRKVDSLPEGCVRCSNDKRGDECEPQVPQEILRRLVCPRFQMRQ